MKVRNLINHYLVFVCELYLDFNFKDLKIERKRLKCEKVDLLNQTKELYKTIEAKENEIRDFLRHYENKTRETANAVKRVCNLLNAFFFNLDLSQNLKSRLV